MTGPTWPGPARLLVVGDLMLDRYLHGSVHRVSPEAPVPVLEQESQQQLPGGAANAAANLAALGHRVALVGAVGADEAGEQLRAAVTGAGVDASGLVALPERPTTVKQRVVASGQQIVRIDTEARGPLPAAAADRLTAAARERLGAADAVLISDYDKGVCGPALCRAVIGAARAAARPVVVDPKRRDFGPYRGATVVTPNRAEADRAAGLPAGEDVEAVGQALLAGLDGSVLITRGAEGMSLFEPDGTVTHLAARARRVYDVTGAGDTVAAVLTAALACGLPPAEGCRLANQAAAVVVGRPGTAVVRRDDLSTAGSAR